MFVLMIRGLTLPGAMNGVKFYVLPDWSKLMEAQVSVTLLYKIPFTTLVSFFQLTLQFEGQIIKMYFGLVDFAGVDDWGRGRLLGGL